MTRVPTPPPPRRPALGPSIAAGMLGGGLFLAVALVANLGELLSASPSPAFAAWAVVRSAALATLGGALFGLLAGTLVLGGCALIGRAAAGRWLAPASVLAAAVAATAMAQLTAWWQLAVLAGLPAADAARRAALIRHGLLALAVGATILWASARSLRRRRPGARAGKAWAAVLGAAAVAFGASSWAFRLRPPAVRDWTPSQLVVVALDGLTLRVLAPLVRAGEAPAFARLIREGAWGSLLTYGAASSPIVWTSVATGKRARDHGIDDFVTTAGNGYRAAPYRSYHWRARPVWDILGAAGRTVTVVNWLMTAPPEAVNGALVSRLNGRGTMRAWPPAVQPLIAEVLARERDQADTRARFQAQIDVVFDTVDALLARRRPDFLALYEAATDAAQHRTWKHYQPAHFDPRRWQDRAGGDSGTGADGVDPGDPEAVLADVIPATYRRVDRRLGQLLDRLDRDALLIVVSDHGQLPQRTPRLRLRLDELLIQLGFAARGADGQIDHRHSRAYTLVETPWTPALRINVNLEGRETHGVVPAAQYRALSRRLAERLRATTLEDGTPVFGAITAAPRPASRDGRGPAADLVVEHSRITRDVAYLDRTVQVEGRTLALSSFLAADLTISGDHDRRGVIFVHGRGVRPGPIGQRTVDSALQALLRPLTDRVDALDALLPALGRLGVIERATTLDVTPTLLHAAGLPVGRDMAGRPLSELFAPRRAPRWVASHEDPGRPRRGPDAEGDPEADRELLERLRALGYVN